MKIKILTGNSDVLYFKQDDKKYFKYSNSIIIELENDYNIEQFILSFIGKGLYDVNELKNIECNFVVKTEDELKVELEIILEGFKNAEMKILNEVYGEK